MALRESGMLLKDAKLLSLPFAPTAFLACCLLYYPPHRDSVSATGLQWSLAGGYKCTQSPGHCDVDVGETESSHWGQE